MIVSKNKTTTTEETTTEQQSSESSSSSINLKRITVEEAYKVNALAEMYKAVRAILETIRVDEDDDSSPLLFKTIKLDTGQLDRIKNNTWNKEYELAFPAVFIHFIDVYYLVGASSVNEGRGTCRIHFVLNRLNNEDDTVEQDGFYVYQRIVKAIAEQKANFPALVNKFQLAYFDQPLTFDDGVQPYWIDYEINFSDYSAYRYKDYVERYIVIPPFTNHSDQKEECNTEKHEDHTDKSYDDVSGLTFPTEN